MTINREHFEAWLFSQSKERKFVYVEGGQDALTGCLCCNYLRENFSFRFSVGNSSFRIFPSRENDFPEWLNVLIADARAIFYKEHYIVDTIYQRKPSCFFTAEQAQTTYLSLFPETIINVSGDVVTNSLHGQRGVTQINYAPKS